jgi:hypothetical protein
MPNALKPLTHAERILKFGHITFKAAGTTANPERVVIPKEWSLGTMREVMIPALAKVGVRHSLTFHYKTARRAAQLFMEWDRLGFMDHVKTWNGSWVSRFKRQEGTAEERIAKCKGLTEISLSNHSWGTAFDINAALYPLGKKVPSTSAMYQLADVAARYGFAWGGNFTSRPDGMHFEDVEGTT